VSTIHRHRCGLDLSAGRASDSQRTGGSYPSAAFDVVSAFGNVMPLFPILAVARVAHYGRPTRITIKETPHQAQLSERI
jgi:hypothetical protein